ncbi:hypothetical protein K443DRAFT_115908, partial [Laccaria amethystina LaAM-08-1]
LGPKASTTHAPSFDSFHTSLDPTIEESTRLQANVTTNSLGCRKIMYIGGDDALAEDEVHKRLSAEDTVSEL